MLLGTANVNVILQRIAAIVAGALLLTASAAGLAQGSEKTAHIGILVGGSFAQRGHLEQALLQGLREQGYVEGRNLVIERRYADGRVERTPEFARELAAMKLDAVVTTCTPTTRAAQQAFGSTPIVMAAVAVAPQRVPPRSRTLMSPSRSRTPPAALTCTFGEQFARMRARSCSVAPL